MRRMSSLLNQEDQKTAEAVRDWLAAQSFGATHPVDVSVRRDEDSSGEEAWFFDVILPDPEPGNGTWPIEDLVELDVGTRDEALRLGLTWPWYVLIKPVTDEEQADEDNLGADTSIG